MYCLAYFSSITYANRLKKLLDRKTGYIALMHAPSTISEKGCAYCLRFRIKDKELVERTAASNGIVIKGFFEETEEGYRRIDG